MKYIRTKCGILLQDINNDKYCMWLQTEPTIHDIIAEADTIQELCDYLMVFDNNNKISDIVEIKDRPKDLVEKKLFVEHLFGSNYKLAIETDKGLIYVAKMNEDGELELL